MLAAEPGRGPGEDAAAERWPALGAFLARDILLVSPALREEALCNWREITEDERNLDDRLTVGLVGGTGVGKSTLINALAGAEISASGDRRPTTDRVIAYHHRATRLPEALPRADIAEPPVLHSTAALERVIILDFPDFDSVEELHHEILGRFSPRLDVLIVLVDDVKYADSRLFELLRRLPQSHENLHAILNKVDRLERRYPGRWRAVADEILDDLAGKLEVHAGVRARREGLLAISALGAFLERSRGASSGGASLGMSVSQSISAGDGDGSGGITGDFPALVRFLEGYRQEKRRRAAKELNIEARKASLFAKLRAHALAPALEERAVRIAELVERRRGDLARTLAGIPAGIFIPGERRRIVSGSLSRAASRLGFPADLLLTLAGHLRLRRRGLDGPVELPAARVERHYRAHLEAASNFLRELEIEAGDLLGPAVPSSVSAAAAQPAGGATAAEGPFAAAGAELERGLTACEAALARRSRLWNHALPAIVLALYAWSMAYPAASAALRRLAGDETVSWGSVLKEALLSALGGLSPTAIAGLVLAVAAAYAASAALSWVRQVERVERAITGAEDSIRGRVGARGAAALDDAARAIARWREEREELAGIVGGA